MVPTSDSSLRLLKNWPARANPNPLRNFLLSPRQRGTTSTQRVQLNQLGMNWVELHTWSVRDDLVPYVGELSCYYVLYVLLSGGCLAIIVMSSVEQYD